VVLCIVEDSEQIVPDLGLSVAWEDGEKSCVEGSRFGLMLRFKTFLMKTARRLAVNRSGVL
jgi:hypothetical protein